MNPEIPKLSPQQIFQILGKNVQRSSLAHLAHAKKNTPSKSSSPKRANPEGPNNRGLIYGVSLHSKGFPRSRKKNDNNDKHYTYSHHNWLFIALAGKRVHGADFLAEAVASGASLILLSIQACQTRLNVLTKLEQTAAKEKRNPLSWIAVNSMPRALFALAQFRLRQIETLSKQAYGFPANLVALTGSVGKTSLKEWLQLALKSSLDMPAPGSRPVKSTATTFNLKAETTSKPINKKRLPLAVFATQGNHNNLLGISLDILSMSKVFAFAIFELGMNARGEIKQLSRLIRPHTTVILNVSEAHLGRLGSLRHIAESKAEIMHYQRKGGCLFLGKNFHSSAEKYIRKQARLLTIHPCSLSSQTKPRQAATITVSPYFDSEKFLLKTKFSYQGKSLSMLGAAPPYAQLFQQTRTLSAYLLSQINSKEEKRKNLAASAGLVRSLPAFPLEKFVKNFQAQARRFQQVYAKPLIIHDAYNASPASMKAALLFLEKLFLKGDIPLQNLPRKIFYILGDMLELGHASQRLHRQLAPLFLAMAQIAPMPLSFFFCGKNMAKAAEKLQSLLKQQSKETKKPSNTPEILTFSHIASLEKYILQKLPLSLDSRSLLFFKASLGMQFDTPIQKLIQHLGNKLRAKPRKPK